MTITIGDINTHQLLLRSQLLLGSQEMSVNDLKSQSKAKARHQESNGAIPEQFSQEYVAMLM